MFRWLESKRKGKVHELDPQTGISYCKVENNGEYTRSRLCAPSPFPPKERKSCWCCKEIKKQRLYDETHGQLDREFTAIMR